MKTTKPKHLYKLFSVDKDIINIESSGACWSKYHRFLIPKKNGGMRTLYAPNDVLKRIQLIVKKKFLDDIKISNNAHGFVKGRSIVSNAIQHVNKGVVYNIDLKDFFPSIKRWKVFNVFNETLKMNRNISRILSNICTYNNFLPQGAPTSPILSNIVSIQLDKRLSGYAKKNNLVYTRYADDITFSGKTITSFNKKIIKEIISDEGYEINKKKERVHKSDDRQIVTGLIVNEKLRVSEDILLELKNIIHYARKFGLVSHMINARIHKSFYKEYIYGKAYFVKMVNEKLGESILEKLDEIDWYY